MYDIYYFLMQCLGVIIFVGAIPILIISFILFFERNGHIADYVMENFGTKDDPPPFRSRSGPFAYKMIAHYSSRYPFIRSRCKKHNFKIDMMMWWLFIWYWSVVIMIVWGVAVHLIDTFS